MVGKQQKTQFLVRLPSDLKSWVEDEAAKNFTSQNAVIVRSVAALMEQVTANRAAAVE